MRVSGVVEVNWSGSVPGGGDVSGVLDGLVEDVLGVLVEVVVDVLGRMRLCFAAANIGLRTDTAPR